MGARHRIAARDAFTDARQQNEFYPLKLDGDDAGVLSEIIKKKRKFNIRSHAGSSRAMQIEVLGGLGIKLKQISGRCKSLKFRLTMDS